MEHNDFIDLPVLERKSAVNESKIEYTEQNCNPLIGCSHRCKYCYSADLDVRWRKVPNLEAWYKPRIYTNFITLLKTELETGKVDTNREIFFSTMTDVYQPFAFRHNVARRIIELLQEYNCVYRVLTKSPLIAKDIELYDGYERGRIGLSITTNKENDTIRKYWEPGTRSIQQRIDAMATLATAEVDLWVSFEPFLPQTNFNSVFEDLIGKESSIESSIIEMEIGKMNYRGIDGEFNWEETISTIEEWRSNSITKHWHYKSQTQKYLLKHYPELTPIGGYP